MIAAIFKNDLRHWLILLNIFAVLGLVGYVIYTVITSKRARTEAIEKSPANLTPFLEDEDLEGRRLERVQGWALIFAAVVAVALPFYWLREPTRQNQSIGYFDKNSVRRGAVLFANSSSPDYESATSLLCANCHGQKGVGGVAPFTVNGVKVNWKAPPLNTEALRFAEDPACLDQSKRLLANPPAVCQLTDIITFGRPGTPMVAWGVDGGGPKNPQAIADLVAYIESIQLSPAEAQQQAANALTAARATVAQGAPPCSPYLPCPGLALIDAQTSLTAAQTKLADKAKTARKALSDTTLSDADLTGRCKDIANKAQVSTTLLTGTARNQAVACGEYLAASDGVSAAAAGVQWAMEWERRRANVSDGELLFELNCARCHTAGWSAFNASATPGTVNSVDLLGLAGGGGGLGGGIGPNLRDGDVIRRFGTDESGGFAAQVEFISNGSAPFKPYGNDALGTGKMPGFGRTPVKGTSAGPMLTPDQIKEIVYYERYCLQATTYTGVTPRCPDGKAPQIKPTTTTTIAKG